jgi:hypothetical protein
MFFGVEKIELSHIFKDVLAMQYLLKVIEI